MAAPQVVLTLVGIEQSRRHKYMIYTLQFVGAAPVYTTGGETVDFTAYVLGQFKNRYRTNLLALPLPGPKDIEIANDVIGWSFTVTQNTVSPTLKNYLFRMWNGATEQAGTVAYPAGTFGATLAAAPQFLFKVRQPLAS